MLAEYKINETFEIDGVTFKTIEGGLCRDCAFRGANKGCAELLCRRHTRQDGKSVSFRVEIMIVREVGEKLSFLKDKYITRRLMRGYNAGEALRINCLSKR